MSSLAVIAFGGNALQKVGGKGTTEEQMEACYEACNNLIPIIRKGVNIIITHGNGPQVGVKILKEMSGAKQYKLPIFPMHFSVAETQGSIGYMIQTSMTRCLIENKIEKEVLALVNRVEVSAKDQAFQNPTKPVGIYYNEEDMKMLQADNKEWVFKEDAKKHGMYRRVVPSPRPISVKNVKIVEKLAREGNIVICVGGGGIPFYRNENGMEVGVDAVIDKDLASSVLAKCVKANEFIIFTDVPNACLNFGKPDQKILEKVKLADMKKYATEGHFGAGSMGPKVNAVNEFVENSTNNGVAIITTAAKGGKGTIVFQ